MSFVTKRARRSIAASGACSGMAASIPLTRRVVRITVRSRVLAVFLYLTYFFLSSPGVDRMGRKSA